MFDGQFGCAMEASAFAAAVENAWNSITLSRFRKEAATQNGTLNSCVRPAIEENQIQ